MSKLNAQERKKFAYEKLEEQRHLLRKSINEITKGDLAEALHAATAIRVLVHDTASSKALLKQLNPNYLQLEILDVPPPKKEATPPGVTATVVMSIPIGMTLRKEGTFLNSELDVEGRVPTILGKWWERPALTIPGAGGFSRREIVLGLANKEGGAHVDTDIPEKYRKLMGYGSLRAGWGAEITTVNVSRLMAGQAGLEMLRYLDKHFPPPK